MGAVVTIYRDSGEVYREVICASVEPYADGIVRVREPDGEFLTNMPFVAEHVPWGMKQPDEREKEDVFDVVVAFKYKPRRFEGACGLCSLKGMVGFWHEGKPVWVCGPVVVKNFRKANKERSRT